MRMALCNQTRGGKMHANEIAQSAIALLGIVIYGLNTNPKVIEVGRIMVFAALLAFLRK
jgi:hypothetical protein